MSNEIGYKKQKNLSSAQFLAELPSFIALVASAILSRNLLVFIDLFDSFIYLISLGLIVVLSKKLTKDLKYEYNYGVGKIEAISSLFCDGIAFFGLLITIGLSVNSIIFPEQPSDFVIAVVGLKVINVGFDAVFFIEQRKIIKLHQSAISKANYVEALSSLLFDSVTLVSLFVIWLFRDNSIGGYISPIISIFIAIYLMFGYVKRTKQALDELTDKTLPEEYQIKILNKLSKFYDEYSMFYSINSRKNGDIINIDIHLSFDKDTTFDRIINLKKELQLELVKEINNCFYHKVSPFLFVYIILNFLKFIKL